MARSEKRFMIRGVVWSALTIIINAAINLLITPYVTNNIGIEAYGFVAMANTFTGYVNIVATAINAFAVRNISIAYIKEDYDRANRFFSATIRANLILSALIMIPLGVVLYRLTAILQIPTGLENDIRLLFLLVVIKFLISVLQTAFNASTFICNNIYIREFHRCVSYVIQGCLLILMCRLFKPHVWYVGVAGMVAVFYSLFISMAYTKKLTPKLKYKRSAGSFSTMLELLKVGIWNSLSCLGGTLNSEVDILLSNIMLNPFLQGNISVAENIGAICTLFVCKISEALQPKGLSLYAQEKKEDLIALLCTSMRLTGMAITLIIGVFILCGKDFLNIWIPNQNNTFIFSLTRIVLFGGIGTLIVYPLRYAFELTKRIRIPAFVTITLGICNIGSMIALIRNTDMGAYAVVWTTAVLNSFLLLFTPLYAAKSLRVSPAHFFRVEARYLIALAVVSGIATMAQTHIPSAESLYGLLVKGACATFACMILVVPLLLPFRTIKDTVRSRIRLH